LILTYGLILSTALEPRVFGVDLNFIVQIASNLVNLGLLAALLAFLLYRPVRKALRNRTEKIQGQLAHAEEEMARATELKLQ